MFGVSLRDRIRNEVIRQKTKIIDIDHRHYLHNMYDIILGCMIQTINPKQSFRYLVNLLIHFSAHRAQVCSNLRPVWIFLL